MKYFSPEFWLQAGVTFLALQQAAQSAPLPIHKTLSKEDFKKLTPHRQREYLQTTEHLIYNIERTPLTRSEGRRIYANYNEILPEYTGTKRVASVIKSNPFIPKENLHITEYEINDAEPDSQRQRDCPRRLENEIFGSQAEAIKCLKENETQIAGTPKVGKVSNCERAGKKVTCVSVVRCMQQFPSIT